ncbi:MAG: MarR family transcriptional regulator, partial [Myxococcales bacterium]|nr:MarR family transcriptional regulator [Myxococcales bacterium]
MTKNEALRSGEVERLLRRWLGVQPEVGVEAGGGRADVVAHHGDVDLVVEVKGSDAVAQLDAALRHLAALKAAFPKMLPIVAAPFVGPKARAFLADRDASWMDLSGNADIRGPGVRVLIEGQPNRFAAPGRPSTAFSRKASRLSRAMLVEPSRWWQQKELAEATGLSDGYVSKVVRRLEDDGLVARREDDGQVQPASPSLMLDAWAQVYDFARHRVQRAHAVGRTGASVLQTLGDRLAGVDGLTWAATGLAAAWQWSRFADFRLVTVFVSRPIGSLEALGLRPVDRGENVWLVAPRDEGVFYGAETVDGVRCAPPVQVYLDLLG